MTEKFLYEINVRYFNTKPHNPSKSVYVYQYKGGGVSSMSCNGSGRF